MNTIKKITAAAALFFICTFTNANAAILKYSNAGTLSNWTEESYYNSPAVCDLDGDGRLEIIFSNYSITVLDAESGSVKWKVNSGHDRSTPFSEFGMSVGHTWCDAVVKDIDNDGGLEIITVHGNGLISVLDKNGYFKPGWPQTPLNVSARSVKADDIDGDGMSEIVVGYGVGALSSVYTFTYNGMLRNGWPQLADQSGKSGWSYGIFMNGISIDDINNDGKKEIIVPTDTSFISAYNSDGTLVKANSEVYGGRNWAQIAFYEDYASEIRGDNGGWGQPVSGNEMREELYKAEFGHAVTTVADIDNDGKKEIVASLIMCNRKYAPVYPPSEYMSICILNGDRTRYNNTALDADWSIIPTDLGKPLVQNSESIASGVCQTPVVSDIDGDGKNEILFNSYNGKVHCFKLDKSEPYAWPYSLTKRTSPLYEYASAPVCVDIDFDGKKEIIFASSYDETQPLYQIMRGSLYILNYEGKLISKTPLPPSKEANNKHNGVKSAPVVYDIDGDGRYEVILNTTNGAICVFDL
ncbi:MAG: VCBS repeat-containing protein [Clostridia bacterium]|nr:VCBS repeat-containing protein [Clostridia bacterium]